MSAYLLEMHTEVLWIKLCDTLDIPHQNNIGGGVGGSMATRLAIVQ